MTEKELKEYKDFMNNPCNIYISVKSVLQMRVGNTKQKGYYPVGNTTVGLMLTTQQASGFKYEGLRNTIKIRQQYTKTSCIVRGF